MTTRDLTVMGAGVFGLSIAYACAKRGASVQVIDPNGVAAGASGGIVGALAPHVPENWNEKKAFQLESLLMAETFWAGVTQTGGEATGYARTGRLQPLNDAAAVALARQREEGAASLWQGQAVWRVVPVSDHPHWAPPSPSGMLVHDTLSARIHPRRATQALAAAILAMGGLILGEGDPQGKLVWATGHAGLADVLRGGQTLGDGVKGQAALLQFDAPDAPQLFADALHIVPHDDGTVAVGSTSERDWTDPQSTDAQLDEVVARARAAFPVLANAPVIQRWAAVRPRAKSRAPLLGVHPIRKEAYIANGGFKIGFGMAPMVAEVMADLLLDGCDRIPPGFRA